MASDDVGKPLSVEQPTPKDVFVVLRARELQLSRLLVVFIGTGLAFMLLPGTFLGVWNLLAISAC